MAPVNGNLLMATENKNLPMALNRLLKIAFI
jgi:hypothetical protein